VVTGVTTGPASALVLGLVTAASDPGGASVGAVVAVYALIFSLPIGALAGVLAGFIYGTVLAASGAAGLRSPVWVVGTATATAASLVVIPARLAGELTDPTVLAVTFWFAGCGAAGGGYTCRQLARAPRDPARPHRVALLPPEVGVR
jgi:hypothetical protein